MPLLHSTGARSLLAQSEIPSAVREQLLPRATPQQLSAYFHQMRALLNAGVGLMSALDQMGRSATNANLRGASMQMKQQLSRGGSWSESMRAFPGLFSRITVGLIDAGEKTGDLVGVCGQLSEFAEQEYRVRELYRRETWYPKVLLFVSTVLIPLPISLVIYGRPFTLGFHEQALIIGVPWLVWGVVELFWPLTSRGKPRLMLDRLKLKTPIVQKVARGFAVAKVWRVLSLLYGAGVSLPSALRTAAQACGNAAIAQSLEAVAPRLERGETLSEVLTSTGDIPEGALGPLRGAEHSGDFDKNLPYCVRMLEMDAEMTLFQATKTITQLLYLFVAFKVALQIIQAWTGSSLHIGS